MTNLAHWQDDIDDALGGDFDGSLSGLCIMSLSFDFTRNNAAGPQATSLGQTLVGAASQSQVQASSQQQQQGILASIASASNKSYSAPMSHDNDNSSNCFKRFKPAPARQSCPPAAEDQEQIRRQLQKLKNSLTAQKVGESDKISSSPMESDVEEEEEELGREREESLGEHEHEQDQELEQDEEDDEDDESSRPSTADAGSLSPSQSCSSIPPSSPSSRASSRASSRSQSPSDMSIHLPNNASNNNNSHNNNNNGAINSSNAQATQQATRTNLAILNRLDQASKGGDNQQVSIYSVKDSILNGSTLKESSYTTSVITTTAPMHFKSIHHPFSFKQFPLSPYHQFSNSSLNHDFYDRYLSHDGHQPLQTPLIGIERTQDLLSLKLPPHGPEPIDDSQRFSAREWANYESDNNNKNDQNQPKPSSTGTPEAARNSEKDDELLSRSSSNKSSSSKRKELGEQEEREQPKGFPFNYKSNSSFKSSGEPSNQPIDLNVTYGHHQHQHHLHHHHHHHQSECCNNSQQQQQQQKTNNNNTVDIFSESMKHFNPSPRVGAQTDKGGCYDLRSSKNLSPNNSGNQINNNNASSSSSSTTTTNNNNNNNSNSTNNNNNNSNNTANAASNNQQASQFGLSQESMFGLDGSKQKFQYMLAAPISVATKLTEDTMTYLNQGQAYEIKLENLTDVAEAKKGFMCSIINIGFHERHMQQAENELWQQWSQQHPNEKIFSVDMKLSHNVFGVQSDGLNKYEFLWDSSKIAGVFIRINSISTEFTPKKHGGEKGVPFKLSIETFSYNSKTHDSYFISAASCQIKVFKPKGAERKIRSDRDKVSKRPASEQDKYHRSCDHTTFRECSLASLHPSADSSLCYYRHSHGHFASKQLATPQVQQQQQQQQQQSHQSDDEMEQANNNSSDQAPNRSPQVNKNNDSDSRPTNEFNERLLTASGGGKSQLSDYSTSRLMQSHNYGYDNNHTYGPPPVAPPTSEVASGFANSTTDLLPFHHHHHHHPHHHQQPFNQIYGCHGGQAAVRNLANINAGSHHQNFNIATYYGHHPANSIPQVAAQAQSSAASSSSSYETPPTATTTTALNHTFSAPPATHSHHHHHQPPHHHHHHQPHHGLHKSASTIYKQLSQHEAGKFPAPAGGPLRAHNFPPTSGVAGAGGSFSSFLSTSHPTECTNPDASPSHNAPQEPQKDYQVATDSYHDHQHHPNHSNFYSPYGAATAGGGTSHLGPHHHSGQVAGARHRSASMNASQVLQCSSYAANVPAATKNQHLEAYVPTSGTMFPVSISAAGDNQPAAGQGNYWTAHGSAQLNTNNSSPNGSNCTLKAVNQHHQHHPHHDTHNGHNYNDFNDCNNHHYDSEQNSPYKNHTSDSSSSCNSRLFNRHPQVQMNAGFHGSLLIQQSPIDRSTAINFGGLQTQITASSNCSEVLAWFTENRFGPFIKTFSNFCGSDLLRLSKTDLIEICGLIDGIRLYNRLHSQPIKPRRVLYVSYENNELFHPIYLYNVTLKELLRELSVVFCPANNQAASTNKRTQISAKVAERQRKISADKPMLNSGSSADSRSSLGALSAAETATEEVYSQSDHYFADIDMDLQQQQANSNNGKCQQATNRKLVAGDGANRHQAAIIMIDKLLIDGLTPVKIVATEQVVQILENESVWNLSLTNSSTGLVEACISACHGKRTPK